MLALRSVRISPSVMLTIMRTNDTAARPQGIASRSCFTARSALQGSTVTITRTGETSVRAQKRRLREGRPTGMSDGFGCARNSLPLEAWPTSPLCPSFTTPFSSLPHHAAAHRLDHALLCPAHFPSSSRRRRSLTDFLLAVNLCTNINTTTPRHLISYIVSSTPYQAIQYTTHTHFSPHTSIPRPLTSVAL
ncbi:uncharacterized protein EI97DRAFT_150963 [Westerdykella ornata]|uniref:Uncharacterized protein n=1 Tax=Westerdykella ornata TaxID=318751 RepID=A0A6A6JBS8_WESOR|nr:uncharacterized protein EI97DRAFT_150963 [Westerdykella ornata]KAF2273717.1 hypothetical protein EI97DRAFT_150963 [Westerdykella ornata]